MDGVAGQPEDQPTEDVAVEGLLRLALLESLSPVGWGELEDAASGPTGQEAQQVAEVAERLDAVESAAGQERNKDGVHLGAVVAAAEQPVFPLMESYA